MRIAFFGLPLAALLLHSDGHDIVSAALPRRDSPGIRRLTRVLGSNRVAMRPKLDGRYLEVLRAAAPELLVSWFWTTKLPMSFVRAVPLGGVGVHPSLLPRHRGPDPTAWAILSGDAETGVTAHRIAAEYDTGAILARRALRIRPEWNAWQLAKALDRPSLSLLREVVAAFAAGTPPAESPQDEASATPAPLPEDEELELDFGQPTESILRRVRAFAPSPGAFFEANGKVFTLLAARECPVPSALERPSEGLSHGGRAIVRTADGAIELLEVELGGVPIAPSAVFEVPGDA